MLRYEAGRDPLNSDLTALVGELSMRRPQFAGIGPTRTSTSTAPAPSLPAPRGRRTGGHLRRVRHARRTRSVHHDLHRQRRLTNRREARPARHLGSHLPRSELRSTCARSRPCPYAEWQRAVIQVPRQQRLRSASSERPDLPWMVRGPADDRCHSWALYASVGLGFSMRARRFGPGPRPRRGQLVAFVTGGEPVEGCEPVAALIVGKSVAESRLVRECSASGIPTFGRTSDRPARKRIWH